MAKKLIALLRNRFYRRIILIALIISGSIFLIYTNVHLSIDLDSGFTATNIISIFLSLVLVMFTGMTWLTYEKLAALADLQNQISKRNFWLTDELQSNSKTQLILRAHELGIPVMYWDPTEEIWDPNTQPWHPGRGHRKIAQMPLVIMYLPKHERKYEKDFKFIPGAPAKPFSKGELVAIKAERKRLEKIISKRRRAKSVKR